MLWTILVILAIIALVTVHRQQRPRAPQALTRPGGLVEPAGGRPGTLSS